MRVFFNGSFKRKTTAMDASCDYANNDFQYHCVKSYTKVKSG